MIEIPEANVLASQLIETILDKKISETKVPESPGKFSFYNGDPQSYNKMLSGGTVSGAKAVGGFIELNTVSENLLFGDGVELTYHPDGSKIPKRIPGLGNSVLQDILWKAKLHPRRKVNSLNEEEKDALFSSIKRTLRMMTEQGGRDTEKDLFGNKGGVMRL